MKTILVFLLLLLPLIMFAQSYTLQELLDQALEKNTTIKQAQLTLNVSRARLSSAKVNYLPDVSAFLGRRESFDNIMFEGNQTTNSMGFSVTKNISLNNDDYFTNKNAKHDLTSAEIDFEIKLQNFIFDFIKNYIEVLERQKSLKLEEDNILIQENIVSESQVLFHQNRITQFEVQTSEINLLNARINSLSAQNQLKQSRNSLFDMVNISDEGQDLTEIDLYSEETDFSRKIDFDKILSIRQQNEAANKHRTNITQTKLDFFPSLSLNYNYGRTLTSPDFTFDTGRTDHTISLNLSYSLNRLFKNNYAYKQTQYLAEHYELNTSQLLKDISQKYEQYIDELTLLVQMKELLENRLQQTRHNLETAQQRYRLGRLTKLDIDEASKNYLDAQINREKNYYRIMLTKLSIDQLLSNIKY